MLVVGLVPENLNAGNEEAWLLKAEYFAPAEEVEAEQYYSQLVEESTDTCYRPWMGESMV